MTTVGCDAGLTSTTFHGSPLNPLLCGSPIYESAQSKFIRLVRRKQTITFILTFRLSFGAHGYTCSSGLGCLLNVINLHKTMPEHKYQLCQNQEVDGAATTLINLSMALQKSGRRRRGRQRLGCRHAGCDVIRMVSRWCSAEDIVWLQRFSYLLEVLEDAHMSGKTKKNIRIVSINILRQVSNLSYRMQRECCMARKSLLYSVSYLCRD